MTERYKQFMEALEKFPLRTTYARITLLTFDEQIEGQIEGNITSGSVSVNGSSAIRRTINLSMLVRMTDNAGQTMNTLNHITMDRKIRVEVGLKNPLRGYDDYCDENRIVWFNQGMYLVSTASISRGTNGWTVSLTAKDKMAALDGTAGGILPASVTFHEKWIIHDDESITIDYPTIATIIREAVHHWGGELAENIIISDVPETAKMLVRYMGDRPIYFDSSYSSFSFSRRNPDDIEYIYGQDAGYQETPFTYPGELVLSAGDTVVTLLDKIKNALSNYEYFYDVDGKFHFQQIKNFLNTDSPNLTELDLGNFTQTYDNSGIIWDLTSLDTTTAITQSPKYDNLKNDFYVWGTRQTPAGQDVGIRFHLAIDTKPTLVFANRDMWLVYEPGEKDDEGNVIKDELPIRYEFGNRPNASGYSVRFIARACGEWREELYRRALIAQVTNSQSDMYEEELNLYNQTLRTNYYEAELLAEWRNLYNPNITGYMGWTGENGWGGWNPDVLKNPGVLNYWLEFIDSSAALGKYSLREIGRRTKVVNSSDIKIIYNREVPDIVFIESDRRGCGVDTYGQKYFQLTPEYYDLFSISTTGASCYDKIRELMYTNLNFNTAISLTCLPKYYMDVNTIIHIEDEESHINGDYQVTQFSLPLAYNGTMSISATEVLNRV